MTELLLLIFIIVVQNNFYILFMHKTDDEGYKNSFLGIANVSVDTIITLKIIDLLCAKKMTIIVRND